MIAFLSGVVRYIDDTRLIIETGGVGYSVAVKKSLAASVQTGSRVEVFTHLVSREDAMDLYGFQTHEELEIFRRLLSVTSVGPKTALGILNKVSLGELTGMIIHGDTQALQGIPGIGKKTSERLVLELQQVFGKKPQERQRPNTEEIEALVSLGYSSIQARDALAKVPRSIKGVDARVKAALKTLAKA